MKFFKIPFTITLVISVIILTSCEKDDANPDIPIEDSVYWYLDGLMNYWYFWNEEITEVDYTTYSDPALLMEDLTVEQDKWSFIGKAETITSLFKEGEEYGFGFNLGWDNLNNLRVIICYNNSTAYDQGIRRGWTLQEIDDVHVLNITSFEAFFDSEPRTMKFDFTDDNNIAHTITLSKELFNLNAVFTTNTFDVDGKNTGYLSYQSFLEYSEDELIDALTILKSKNIDELIVDLRYNSGGLISNAQNLSNIIVPPSELGNIFYSLRHNDINSNYDSDSVFSQNDLNLGLNRVFFITNEYSASASELVINGLEPHMEVLHIGDSTSGKPYAMYGFSFQDWLIFPVTAKILNANGYGDYEDGIIPDQLVTDNHRYDWGDERDPAIKQAIHYIQYGTFDMITASVKSTIHKPGVLNADIVFDRRSLLLIE
jgi:C-terminal processing protease CtpA/Prc